MRQLMGLAWSYDERHRPSEPVGDPAGFGPIAPPESGPGLHGRLAQLKSPFSGGTGCLLLRPDAGAVEKCHPEVNAAFLREEQQPLPDPEPGSG